MRLHLLFATFALLPLCALADTYKCKQPDGRVAFQDQPCQGTATGTPIAVRPTPPSADAAEIERMKAANAQASEAPLRSPRAKDENARQQDAFNRSVRCENARNSLGALKMVRPVFRYDNQGNKQYVEDKDRQSELVAAQRRVAENCN